MAKDKQMFPFGMLASQGDMEVMLKVSSKIHSGTLQMLGFVPPPIVGDPMAQRRNKVRVRDWLNQFSNPRAIIRHHANRWVRAGRMGTHGDYIECESNSIVISSQLNESSFTDDDEEMWPEEDITYTEPEEDESHLPPKREVQSQVSAMRLDSSVTIRCSLQIIYVDTSQYDDYVRWYQKMHGYTPLPENEQQQHDHLRAFYAYYRTSRQYEELQETTMQPQAPATEHEGNNNAEVFIYILFNTFSVIQAEATTSKEDDGSKKSDSSKKEESLKRVSMSKAYGDYYAMARWRWAQWERYYSQVLSISLC